MPIGQSDLGSSVEAYFSWLGCVKLAVKADHDEGLTAAVCHPEVGTPGLESCLPWIEHS